MNTSPSLEAPRLPSNLLLGLIAGLAALMLIVSTGLVFFYAPYEAKMGFVQKIFYFHVPAAWMMMLSTPLMLVSSILYLFRRKPFWDRLGDAALELSIVFGALVLITGPLWGRKAWGVYWVWDVRLTATLVLILMLIAAKIVRSYAGPNRKTIAAGLSLLSVLNAGFVWVSVDLWRGNHPEKLVATLEPRMKLTLFVAVFAFHLIYIALLWVRLRVSKLEDQAQELERLASEAGLED